MDLEGRQLWDSFSRIRKKTKEEETVTPVVETTPEVPAKEGMILVREGIKLGLPTVSMEEAIVAAGELLKRSWICR